MNNGRGGGPIRFRGDGCNSGRTETATKPNPFRTAGLEMIEKDEIPESLLRLHRIEWDFEDHLWMQHAQNIHNNDGLLQVLGDIHKSRDAKTLEHECKRLLSYVIYFPEEFTENIEKMKQDKAIARSIAWFISPESADKAPVIKVNGREVRITYADLKELARHITEAHNE